MRISRHDHARPPPLPLPSLSRVGRAGERDRRGREAGLRGGVARFSFRATARIRAGRRAPRWSALVAGPERRLICLLYRRPAAAFASRTAGCGRGTAQRLAAQPAPSAAALGPAAAALGPTATRGAHLLAFCESVCELLGRASTAAMPPGETASAAVRRHSRASDSALTPLLLLLLLCFSTPSN